MNSAVSQQGAWQQHVTGAVRKFLKTAVVIDNQPSLVIQTELVASAPDSSWFMDEAGELEAPSSSAFISDINDLNIRNITDAFISEGIACAFVLPDDNTNEDDAKIERSLKAAKVSDLVVIDWFLKDKDSSLTQQILELVASSDSQENGRLRLVCVYTGQILTEQIFTDIMTSFSNGGIELQRIQDRAYCASASSTLVMLINKGETAVSELPALLINQFALLADGLVPTFALAAVGAIRKNIHHFVTRFSNSLDPAYISNRLITNPPGDVTELMRELLVAEFDNAIGIEKVADQYLDIEAIEYWLQKNEQFISPQGNGKNPGIDADFLKSLLHSCLETKGFLNALGELIKLPEDRRGLVSVAVAGDITKSQTSQNEFSRLVAFKREASSVSSSNLETGWRPSLTTGSLLRSAQGKYYVCFTPACDTLRLTQPSSFVFLEATVVTDEYNVLVKDFDAENIGLRFEKKRPVLITYIFVPDDSQRVRAKNNSTASHFIFETADGVDSFTWMGEIRYGRATSEMAQIVSNWMRIGINDSEYLRLVSAGKINFPQ